MEADAGGRSPGRSPGLRELGGRGGAGTGTSSRCRGAGGARPDNAAEWSKSCGGFGVSREIPESDRGSGEKGGDCASRPERGNCESGRSRPQRETAGEDERDPVG